MTKELEPVKLMYELSSVLTGYDEMALRGTGLGPEYLTTTLGVVRQDVVEEMLGVWVSIKEADETQAGRRAAVKTRIVEDAKFGPLTRNVVKLWFLGVWYRFPVDESGSSAWHRQYGTGQNVPTFVVSDGSYVEALVWNDMGAHPQAAKWPGWGTWSWPPRGTWQ